MGSVEQDSRAEVLRTAEKSVEPEQGDPPGLTQHCAKLAVLIVSYRNPADVDRCLRSLGRSNWIDFEVFVCENAGPEAFIQLRALLTRRDGPLERVGDTSDALDRPGGRLAAVLGCRFRDRAITVRLAAATENLGYAGGVNAWLERLIACPGWEAVLVLNPDTAVGETCLSELMAKAAEGFGMVGGTLVFDDSPDRIINYGLIWSPATGRVTAVGRNSPAGSSPSDNLLKRIDAISGACVLVTRSFIDDVGLMAEDYFLYMEELDWGRRRGRHKIGFAPGAVIRHVSGASIGSTEDPKARSPLSAYLLSRNSILFSRRWAGWRWPLHFAVGLLYVLKYALHSSPEIAKVALVGLIDGFKGKTGRPDMSVYHPLVRE
jgi:N-acetylglucosaminyl-diphospho-decaprenol L-rhamnosyltransferase